MAKMTSFILSEFCQKNQQERNGNNKKSHHEKKKIFSQIAQIPDILCVVEIFVTRGNCGV